ncbi:hypothetical protein LCGC14_2177980, partial [marine sediment metagenome]
IRAWLDANKDVEGPVKVLLEATCGLTENGARTSSKN